jgi:hypothetical protein
MRGIPYGRNIDFLDNKIQHTNTHITQNNTTQHTKLHEQ